jgi:phosphoribosylformylglycinamidine synthase
VHGVTDAGAVPAFDASAPRRYRLLHRAIRDGLVRACHDIAEGGIAVALAEMAIAGRMGVEMSSNLSVAQLFSESNGRFLLEVSPAHVDTIIEQFGDEAIVIGLVTSEQEMRLPNNQSVSIQELCSAWQEIS